jgi:DeoR/GlpR family transcriptional regulator of sugar metabolism
MLLIEREKEIVQMVNQRGAVSVRELAQTLDVTEVTIRRDLKKLEELRLLQRTHGGAARVDGLIPTPGNGAHPEPADHLHADALILAPVQTEAAHTLRERALRASIPLIAESAPLDGAIYLGPRNYECAVELGRWAGAYVRDHLGGTAHVLDIQLQLSNTRARSAGFAAGLRDVLGEAVHLVSIDGLGLYNEAYAAALNALRVHPEINVIFGINDDSVLGGLQAYLDLDRDPAALLAVNVGGEGKTLFDVLQRGGALKACLALFPEVVGREAVDGALRALAGEAVGEIITPAAILTADTLTDYYTLVEGGWQLNEDAAARLAQTRWTTPLPLGRGRRLALVIHFRTHEWYQNVAAAAQRRADALGVVLSVEDVNEDVRAEIAELRRLIGKMAATYVRDGDTIILDAGTPTASMAQFLDGHQNLTVITNSIAVFQRLGRNPNVRLILTGGEFQRESGAFVGRGAQLLLHEIRADKAFMVASGVSESFGVSCKDPAEADVRRAMLDAAREVVLLADHTVLGVDSRVRVAPLDAVHTLVTDPGLPSHYRLRLNQRGVRVMVAGEVIPAKREAEGH